MNKSKNLLVFILVATIALSILTGCDKEDERSIDTEIDQVKDTSVETNGRSIPFRN